jgi:hypothetical protein
MTRYGNRSWLDPSQTKSSTGAREGVWPLRIADRREDCGADPALVLRTEPASRLGRPGFNRG